MGGGDDSLNSLFSIQVIILCAGYVLSASSEIWSINAMKDIYHVDFPIFSALLLNSYWPIQGIIYYNLRQKQTQPRVLTWQTIQSYIILGALASAVSLTRCYGIVDLPAILYVISSNTEIVWETAMTYFILGRNIDKYQITAVIFVISGVMVSLYNPDANTFGDPSTDDDRSKIIIGVLLSCLSRLLSSLNTILAERFLGKDRKSELGVCETSLSNSFIPFCLLPIMYIFVPEYKQYSSGLTGYDGGYTFLLVVICLSLCIAKLVDRLCKFSLVVHTSTMFFASVDAAMKIIAGFGSIIFFHEGISWTEIVGFVLIIISFIPMRVGSHREKMKAESLKEAKLDVRYDRHTVVCEGDDDLMLNDIRASFAMSGNNIGNSSGTLRVSIGSRLTQHNRSPARNRSPEPTLEPMNELENLTNEAITDNVGCTRTASNTYRSKKSIEIIERYREEAIAMLKKKPEEDSKNVNFTGSEWIVWHRNSMKASSSNSKLNDATITSLADAIENPMLHCT